MAQKVSFSEVTPPRGTAWRWRPPGLGLRELTLLPVIALAIVIGSFIHSAFLTTGNFLNILQQSSELSVVVIALSMILIAGKFDLSLESIVGLAPMLGAWLIVTDRNEGGSGFGLNPYLAIVDRARAAGTAVLIVSDDLDELVICSRVLVLFKGRLLAEFGSDRRDEELVAAIEGFGRNGAERELQ